MSWEYKLAKEFKKRDNKDINEPLIGTVTGVNPITISLYGGSVILNNSNSYISSYLKRESGTCAINGENGSCIIDRSLKINDKVLCIPFNHGQTYFIIDKVVG